MFGLKRRLSVLATVSFALTYSSLSLAQPMGFEGVMMATDGTFRNDFSFQDMKYSEGRLTGIGTHRWFSSTRMMMWDACIRSNDPIRGRYKLDEKGTLIEFTVWWPAKNSICGPMGFLFKRDPDTGDFVRKDPSSNTVLKAVTD